MFISRQVITQYDIYRHAPNLILGLLLLFLTFAAQATDHLSELAQKIDADDKWF